MCDGNIEFFAFVAHIPQCYRRMCLQHGMLPLCTCNTCQGMKTHDGDCFENDQQTPTKRPRPTISPSSSMNARRSTSTTMGNRISLDLDVPSAVISIATSRLVGKACIICGSKRSQSNLPLPVVNIGKYRRIIICKKLHLTTESESSEITTAIDQELHNLQSHGDTKANILITGSQEEKEDEDGNSDGEASTTETFCCGYKNLEQPLKCNESTHQYLWITDNKGVKLYFCKASHLLRYMIQHHCAQGKKSGNKRPKHVSDEATIEE